MLPDAEWDGSTLITVGIAGYGVEVPGEAVLVVCKKLLYYHWSHGIQIPINLKYIIVIFDNCSLVMNILISSTDMG